MSGACEAAGTHPLHACAVANLSRARARSDVNDIPLDHIVARTYQAIHTYIK